MDLATHSEPSRVTPSRRANLPSAFAFDLATLSVLWRRDIVRFFRERFRIVGALAQPLMFWLVLGSGMASTFRLPGSLRVGYPEYFFPGVVLMVVLFTSIFATMSVIEDRHQGFLHAVLAGPGSRTAVVLGKCLGSTSIALGQAALFMALAPTAGFSWHQIDWLYALSVLALASVALTTLGFAVAWWLDSTQSYHVVMSLLLIPMWVVSGAMFPASGALGWVMRFDPMAYATTALRRALYSGRVPDGMLPAWSHASADVGVLAAFAVVSLGLALAAGHRRR